MLMDTTPQQQITASSVISIRLPLVKQPKKIKNKGNNFFFLQEEYTTELGFPKSYITQCIQKEVSVLWRAEVRGDLYLWMCAETPLRDGLRKEANKRLPERFLPLTCVPLPSQPLWETKIATTDLFRSHQGQKHWILLLVLLLKRDRSLLNSR